MFKASPMHITTMSLTDATNRAQGLLRDMGRKSYTDRELSILAREVQTIHSAGRLSMLRTVARTIGMTVIGDQQ